MAPRLLVLIVICVVCHCEDEFCNLDLNNENVILTESDENSFWPKYYDDEPFKFQYYDYIDGDGIREELLVRKISIRHHGILCKNVDNWQVFEFMDVTYIVGTEDSTLLLYQFDLLNSSLTLNANITIPGGLKLLKIIKLIDDYEDYEPMINVYLILYGHYQSNDCKLKWFHFLDYTMAEVWEWRLRKPIKGLEYFNFMGDDKLLLLYEDEGLARETLSLFEIYEFNINGTLSQFRSNGEFLLPRVSAYEICITRADKLIISIRSVDRVVLYEYTKDEGDGDYRFEVFQNITTYEARRVMAFFSGSTPYLVASGSRSNLFAFDNSKEMFVNIMAEFFDDMENVAYILSVPVNTYRDEVLLLVQLNDSSIMGLGWHGLEFTPVHLPKADLGNIDLSKVTIIPNYGFLSGDAFVGFEVELNELPRPEENEITEMFQVKDMLQDIIESHRSVITKADSLTKQSSLDDSNLKVDSSSNSTELDDLAALINRTEAQVREIQEKLSHLFPENSTEPVFRDIDIHGSLEVKGSLTVGNLTVSEYLNGVPMDVLEKNNAAGTDNIIISGVKSFPSIDLEKYNFNIRKLNGIPLGKISFGGGDADAGYPIDLSNITTLQVNGDLNVSRIKDIVWQDLMDRVVFKDEPATIPGETIILGNMSANFLKMDYLNDIKFPSGYIEATGPTETNMTGQKYFDTLTVSNLMGLKTINGIDYDDFIKLQGNQTLEHLITFHDLVVDEVLQIDGKITGLPKADIDTNSTLLNSNVVESDIIVSNLNVTGNVYIENLLVDGKRVDLDDIILNDEENVMITGTKTFLSNVHIANNLEIKTGMINGHHVSDFITLDTEQVLPNLSKISGNVEFLDITYRELEDFERSMYERMNDRGGPYCIEKPIIFKEAPIVDELFFSYINENISGFEFSEKYNSRLKNVHFEQLNVQNLIVKNLTAKNINNVNLEEFKRRVITNKGYQNITGNVRVEYLEVGRLYFDFLNGRSLADLQRMEERVNDFYREVFSGKILVNSLNVTGRIKTSRINSIDLHKELKIDDIEEFVFDGDMAADNLVVDGLINNVNFTHKMQDTVLKTDRNVTFTGTKIIGKLKCKNLDAEYINGHSVDDIVTANGTQTLTGPIKVVGSVKVRRNFTSTGNINGIPFKNISGVIERIDDSEYRLKGHFQVHDHAVIRNLNVIGEVQGRNISDFLENLIYLSDEETVITGTKRFNSQVNFSGNLTVDKNINEIDLKRFYETAVFIDRPLHVNSHLIFESDIELGGDLTVTDNLKVKTINSIDIDDLLDNAVYTNRPTSIMEPVTFTNVTFKSNIMVDSWNGVKMDRLFTSRNKKKVIRESLRFVDVSADILEIEGFVNGQNFSEIYRTSFTLTTDQNITGNITFMDDVYVKGDFNSRYINDLDMTKRISLSGPDPLVGNFIFKDPVTVEGDLTVLGNINGVDFSKWKANAVTTANTTSEQIITGEWTVHGNVYMKKKLKASTFVNGMKMQEIFDGFTKHEKDLGNLISNRTADLVRICKEMRKLKVIAENMLYKFQGFEYLKVFQFDKKIRSFHHFEMKERDYIIVNFEGCYLDIFSYTNATFVIAAGMTDFGLAKRYVTFNHGDKLYIVTVGKPACGRSAGNLWSFDGTKINHVLGLGNATDAERLGSDRFLVLSGRRIDEWSLKDISNPRGHAPGPINTLRLRESNFRFAPNDNRRVLVNRNAIFDLGPDTLELREFQNPFRSNEIAYFRAGVFRKEFILSYDPRISNNYVFIHKSDLPRAKVTQTIATQKPSSFLVLNFDKFQENLLIFSENKRTIKIYEYKGIQGFKHHSSIRLRIDKMYKFSIRTHLHLTKSLCLAIADDKKLKILKAKMYGQRLDMKDELVCDVV